jgi:hypothetical protein
MPRVGFEPTIPASKRAKTVHALDLWASTGLWNGATETSGSVPEIWLLSLQFSRRMCTTQYAMGVFLSDILTRSYV